MRGGLSTSFGIYREWIFASRTANAEMARQLWDGEEEEEEAGGRWERGAVP